MTTTIENIQDAMRKNETNDYFYNYLLGCIIDVINPECLEPYGRFIIYGNSVAELYAKQEVDNIELIKISLYALISRLLAIYITAFINIKDTIGVPKELENIDWDYLKNRCSKSVPIYSKFMDKQLALFDEKSVLLFNREKRKVFKNKNLFEDVPFQMPIPDDIKPNDLDLYNCQTELQVKET
jgi:hypothetical protein